MATQSPHIYCLRSTSWESILKFATEIRSQTGRQNGRSPCKYGYMGNVHVRLFNLQFILGTIMQRIFNPSKISPSEHWCSYSKNWEVDQGSERNVRYPSDQFAAAYVAKDNLAYWQGSSVCDCKNLCLPTQCCVWEESVRIPSTRGRENGLVFEFMSMQRFGSNRRGADGVRVEKFPGIHCIADPCWDSEYDDWNKVWTRIIQWRTTLYGEKKEAEKLLLRILLWFQIMLGNSRKDIGRFLGLDQKRSGTELTYTNQMENGTMSLILWWSISVKAAIPFFVDPELFERGDLKSKGTGKLSIHFNGSDETVEVILRTVISFNQRSVYGAVEEICEELALEMF